MQNDVGMECLRGVCNECLHFGREKLGGAFRERGGRRSLQAEEVGYLLVSEYNNININSRIPHTSVRAEIAAVLEDSTQ